MIDPSFVIESISVQRLNIALVQPIKMSFGTVRTQNIVLVRLRDQDGVEGTGEAAVLGGPYWGSESAEGVQAVIERYLAPVLIGQRISGLEAIARLLAETVRGNAAARAAIEMAALDLLGRRLNVSSIHLLGGVCRSELDVAWTLSTGSTAGDIAEGERAIEARGHRRFKVKLGRDNPAADVDRVMAIVDAFSGRASVIADINQGWDEPTARRYLPCLQDAGLEAIEEPLSAHTTHATGAMRQLRERLNMDVIADETLVDTAAAFALAANRGATAFALKPNRDAGAVNTKRLAALAYASGLKLYGGTVLETSLGTAASALIYGSLPVLQMGSELFGPLRLAQDLIETPFTVRDGKLQLPTGIGLGVELDESRIRYIAQRTAAGSM